MKLKSGHNFSICLHNQNWVFCILLYFNLFPNSLKYWKLGFVNVVPVGLHNFSSLWKWLNIGIFECQLRLYFQISPNSLELANWYFWVSLTFIFCQIVRTIFQAWYVCRRVNLWLNCQFSRKKMFTNVYATNLCQFKYWEYCF